MERMPYQDEAEGATEPAGGAAGGTNQPAGECSTTQRKEDADRDYGVPAQREEDDAAQNRHFRRKPLGSDGH